jgi:hypothetical protein
VLACVATTIDVHVPQALSPHLAVSSLASLPIGAVPNVIPIFNFGDRYRELRLRTPHTTTPAVTTTTQFTVSHVRAERSENRDCNHVVPPGLPHLQQLPTLLPARTSKWTPTSNYRCRPWRLRWLLEQPHWSQDCPFLVCPSPSPIRIAPAFAITRIKHHKQLY